MRKHNDIWKSRREVRNEQARLVAERANLNRGELAGHDKECNCQACKDARVARWNEIEKPTTYDLVRAERTIADQKIKIDNLEADIRMMQANINELREVLADERAKARLVDDAIRTARALLFDAQN